MTKTVHIFEYLIHGLGSVFFLLCGSSDSSVNTRRRFRPFMVLHCSSFSLSPVLLHLFILCDGLFINAPPSSLPPPLLHYLSLSLAFTLAFSHLLFPLLHPPHLSSLLPQHLLRSFHPPFIPRFTAIRHLADPLAPSDSDVPLCSASFNLYLPRGCCAALSSPPHESHLGEAPAQPKLCWMLSSSDGAAVKVIIGNILMVYNI